MRKFANLGLLLSIPVIIGACSNPIPSKVMDLKPKYDGLENTHAHHWKAGLDWDEQCSFLYRDNLLDTPTDDWLPFYQGLALKTGEEELNRRRREKPMHEYDNELFTREEKIDYCREVDSVEVDLGHNLDHYQVAIPEETVKLLDKMKRFSQLTRPNVSLKYLDSLNIHYEPI